MEHLSQPELKTCNLVSHQWSAIAKPFLLFSLCLYRNDPTPSSEVQTQLWPLNRLERLKGAHAHLFSHVREVRLEESFFNLQQPTRDPIQGALERMRCASFHFSHISTLEILTPAGAFQRARIGSRSPPGPSGIMLCTMRHAFPNVRTLKLTRANWSVVALWNLLESLPQLKTLVLDNCDFSSPIEHNPSWYHGWFLTLKPERHLIALESLVCERMSPPSLLFDLLRFLVDRTFSATSLKSIAYHLTAETISMLDKVAPLLLQLKETLQRLEIEVDRWPQCNADDLTKRLSNLDIPKLTQLRDLRFYGAVDILTPSISDLLLSQRLLPPPIRRLTLTVHQFDVKEFTKYDAQLAQASQLEEVEVVYDCPEMIGWMALDVVEGEVLKAFPKLRNARRLRVTRKVF
ncbi:hypothetical protein EIP91_009485 [Steccherinum ochraceum]|uniref:Uncharacterized protein n=1 Tax=Steccherinum ochraceum TaxID=92696 RepID=A0A4R0R3V9_9APHY|nr:hypothetical protein EIP91_009485 [Steccherinum ochraceum]